MQELIGNGRYTALAKALAEVNALTSVLGETLRLGHAGHVACGEHTALGPRRGAGQVIASRTACTVTPVADVA
jgi:hypothetical protein